MSDQGYNGWANYETWAMALWIGNEEHTASEVHKMAEECWANTLEHPDATFRGIHGDEWREHQARYELTEWLREEWDDAMPDLGASVWSDLLRAAFSEIDWREIAGHELDAVREAGEVAST